MYLAIDGGGTKTEYLLLDKNFRTVQRYLGGCVNHDFLAGGWEGTKQELRKGTEEVLRKWHLRNSDIVNVVAGLSGIDNTKDKEQMDRVFQELGFESFFVCNDGFLAVWAECPEGTGISYNCGTGVCCAGIDAAGRMEKTAGLDEWSGDAGGGSWIVQNVFRLIYKNTILHKEETAFTEAYKKKFGLNTEEEFLNSWNMLKTPIKYPEYTKDVIEIFFEQLEKEEEEAQLLAEQMSLCAVENIQAVMKRLIFTDRPVSIILAGSIHTKAANRTYLALLEKRLQRQIKIPFTLKIASKPAVQGAVWRLKEKYQ